jgi:hypothetical protein
MVNALKVLKADVKYTEYKGVSHFMWDRAYNEPDLPPWLFEKRRHPTGSARVL